MRFFLLIVLIVSVFQIRAQEHEELWPHSLALMVGYSWIPQTVGESGEVEITVNPTLGLDYGYFFSHKFGLVWVNDVELTSYFVEKDDGTLLKRENKYIGAVVATYEPNRNIALFAGPGIELDRHQSFAILKVGLELGKRFENGWYMGFNGSIDFNEIYQTISAGAVMGKRFPGKKKDNH